MILFRLISLISIAALSVNAIDVASISECPKLGPRNGTAKDVTDLRVDDIQVIAALGDRYNRNQYCSGG